jgi:hypothetical protein
VIGYGYACALTDALYVPQKKGESTQIGLKFGYLVVRFVIIILHSYILRTSQVMPYNYTTDFNTTKIDDCVPVFSTGLEYLLNKSLHFQAHGWE